MRTPSLLVLVRHGESTRNVGKGNNVYFPDAAARAPFAGQGDHEVELTSEGWRQAEQTGYAVRERHQGFERVFHSGYLRTKQTTEGLLRAWTDQERAVMPVGYDLLLRERDTGHGWQLTREEAEAAFPWLDAYWKSVGGFFARPPGGESMADVVLRARIFLEWLCREHSGERVLVVTHGMTLRALRFCLERWDYAEAEQHFRTHPVPNCAVVVYRHLAVHDRLHCGDTGSVFWK